MWRGRPGRVQLIRFGGLVVAEEGGLINLLPRHATWLAGLLILAGAGGSFAAASDPVDPSTFVGNVYGSITDRDTSEPIQGVRVTLLPVAEEPLVARCGPSEFASAECIRASIAPSAVREGSTEPDGSFLINNVPAPADGRDYTVVITHPSHRTAVLPVHVLPGASMALQITARLASSTAGHQVASELSVRYRHELDAADAQVALTESRGFDGRIHAQSFRGSIFSTREGLVGGTTANGHVIVPNDRFAALPSRRALSSNFGHEREARVTYRGRTTVVPVWDVGPWNTKDDYWNPANIRETFKDLPFGKPEAETAFYDHYNGGLDERGRVVKTPAGIDLADGTFLLDLGMTNNDRVGVEYLWVDNAGPLISSISVSPDPVAAGGTISIEAIASDVSTGNAPITAVEFFYDSSGEIGTGSAASPADGAFDSPVETVRVRTSVALNSGQRHTVFLRARDLYGNWGPLVATTFSVVAPARQRAVSH